jgi:hypothetical protein
MAEVHGNRTHDRREYDESIELTKKDTPSDKLAAELQSM